MFFFDVSNQQSFQNVALWLKKLINTITKSVGSHVDIPPIIVVGNKYDKLAKRRSETIEEKNREIERLYKSGKEFAEKNQIPYFEMSIKTGLNVEFALLLLSTIVFNCL